MDPDRVRAYLQAACAGLGFDIGEIWWTSNEHGSSTVAAIQERHDVKNALVSRQSKRHLRFVQLYTSKSYEEKRSMLVNPPEDEDNKRSNGINEDRDEEENLGKHVLSPLLVDAISKTAQVVWANTKKQEGLLGRSDMLLQTAVGMPVAVDAAGNMCCVVMFSPRNVQSSDDAMEYLQSISMGATSSRIPSLMPAFDPKAGILTPHHENSNSVIPLLAASSVTEGVTTRFVSLDDTHPNDEFKADSVSDTSSSHDLSTAPKDCFGIPMLPSFAELGAAAGGQDSRVPANYNQSDTFDEASYGVWSTIMNTTERLALPEADDAVPIPVDQSQNNIASEPPVYATEKAYMSKQRKDRLEEFAEAFLGVSVFELAEVWVPLSGQTGYLGNVLTVPPKNCSESLKEFIMFSNQVLVRHWSGAVGRAFSSGNPVWSANPDVFVDSGRSRIFDKVKFQTVLAIPVFSGKSVTPSFIFTCYSYVRTGSVPFVLKFAQQALRLLWQGLDNVEPHESVSEDLWRNVAPADLGEMTADIEMHQHFMQKKRPFNDISEPSNMDETDAFLLEQLNSLTGPSDVPQTRSIYTGDADHSPPLEPQEPSEPSLPVKLQSIETVQAHISNAISSIEYAVPFNRHKRIATNSGGVRTEAMSFPPASTLEVPTEYQYNGQNPVKMGIPTIQAEEVPPQHRPLSAPSPLPQPSPIGFPPTLGGPSGNGVVSSRQTSNGTSSGLRPPYQVDLSSQASLPNAYSLQGQPQTSSTYVGHNQMNFSSPGTSGVHISNFGSYNSQSHVVNGAPVNMMPHVTIQNSVHQSDATNMTQNVAYCQPVNGISFGDRASMMAPQHSMTTNGTSGSTPRVGKSCRIQGCCEPAVSRRPYCVRHSGNRLCEHDGCSKCAQGSTRFCIAHGGGRRCTFPGCDKGARDKYFCAAHGGGKRCKFDGCSKSAVGGSNLCTAHGGGRRCSVDGCDKSAQSSTKFCVKHGGGKKCSHPGCEKVARGRTSYCASHGGGVRCKLAGCNRVAIGKHQLCRAHGGGTSRARPSSSSDAGSQMSQNGNGAIPVAVPLDGSIPVFGSPDGGVASV